MTGFLFELAFFLVAPVWFLMVLAPRWRFTERLAASPLTVLPLLTLWAVLVAPVLPEFWTAVSNPSIDAFRDLAALANGAGAIWAQILAWDLLLGQWMYREGRRLSVPPLLMGPLLLLTILLSPVALPLFLVVRARWTARARHGERTPAAPAPA
ncbi:abscisic acid-deficient protein Aba4 family protein [Streptomyces sp. NPDC098101]|uniref:abscisic acid-deficient protein Aba4 family protein n=1 Tax=Streptomyces sp. NPDC098101 TaxID=3366096 RepID=UPI0037F35AC9